MTQQDSAGEKPVAILKIVELLCLSHFAGIQNHRGLGQTKCFCD